MRIGAVGIPLPHGLRVLNVLIGIAIPVEDGNVDKGALIGMLMAIIIILILETSVATGI